MGISTNEQLPFKKIIIKLDSVERSEKDSWPFKYRIIIFHCCFITIFLLFKLFRNTNIFFQGPPLIISNVPLYQINDRVLLSNYETADIT